MKLTHHWFLDTQSAVLILNYFFKFTEIMVFPHCGIIGEDIE